MLQSVEGRPVRGEPAGDLGGRAGLARPAGRVAARGDARRADPPERLAAFAGRGPLVGATSADVRTLQAPLRSGVVTEEYQLEPVARAIEAPRVNLLLADDVGLGKTIEAGLVALELLLRHRAKRVMIVCPPGLMVKWQDEMAEKCCAGRHRAGSGCLLAGSSGASLPRTRLGRVRNRPPRGPACPSRACA